MLQGRHCGYGPKWRKKSLLFHLKQKHNILKLKRTKAWLWQLIIVAELQVEDYLFIYLATA